MKKIAIMTFHRPLNYGAALQAVATYIIFEKTNFKPLLIDYRHPRIEKSRRVFDLDKKNSLYQNTKNIIKGILRFRTENNRKNRFDSFVLENSLMSEACADDAQLVEATKNCDLLLVGSDLVWNWDLDKDLNNAFFLTFYGKSDKLKCSYASSIGTNEIPEEYREKYKKYLQSFDYISVREKTAKNILEKISGKQIKVVLDPTLMVEEKEWEKLEKWVKVPEKYVVCYILEFTPNVIEIIRKVEEYYQLPVIYFTRDNVYGAYGVSMYKYGPAEFLFILHHAEFILTNSFHGTVFAMLYNRNFATIPHSTRGSRMRDLLMELQMSERLIRDEQGFNSLVKNGINVDYSNFEGNLERLRKESMEYIESLRG